jgi:hypothetical protein
MRKAMVVIAGMLLILVGTQVWSTLITKGTPQQPYTVLRSIGELEIRHYPEAIAATVVPQAATYRDVANPGFRTLAGYIFGGNADGTKIAMTAPVHMELGAERSTMRFIMPEEHNMESLPLPADTTVHLERLPEEVVAALRFGGFADEERIARESERLIDLLRAAGLEPIGAVRFLGYDPPWQLVARRNEVVVRLRRS